MGKRTIYITEFDKERLQVLLERAAIGDDSDKAYLRSLQGELERAQVLDPRQAPADVVTMNTQVRVKDVDSEEEVTYTLVFPADADIERNRISILAPVGTALLGYRVGSTIAWEVPDGTRRLRIEEILYQPEAAGRYDE